jgi:prolyl-tRNA synthetase
MAKAPILASRAEDFPQWYQDVVAKAELAETGAARGTMVIRPYGYGLWERMQADMDARIKASGAENVYLPLFIPESYLRREAEHVEGFSPELAVVTVAGGKELEEPLVVRPTSETLFGELMAKWIQSYRDLPMLLNQWANVVRWELRPRIFLRTTEFLWQEGHTAHATREDAAAYARRILLGTYRDFMVDMLAMPVLVGMKTARERFAGAINTMTCEGMMGDGRALQMGTSHELGQNFARAFGMQYLDDGGALQHCWTTSWGTTTRMIGGLIMCHGDDHGLRVPPRIANVQVVVLVVRDDEAGTVAAEARRVADELTAAGVRVRVDAQTATGFGRRVTDWEIKGVPVRVELGPRDVGEGVATLARRDDRSKATVPAAGLASAVTVMLDEIQASLLAEATAFRESRTADVATVAEAAEAARTGFARLPWEAVGDDGEDRLADEGVTVRCLQRPDGSVPDDPGEAGLVATVARAY